MPYTGLQEIFNQSVVVVVGIVVVVVGGDIYD